MGIARDGRRGNRSPKRTRPVHPLEFELGATFGLTGAEARVVCLLVEGLSYGEIGDRLDISYHTVHSHMKAIHQKMGVATNLRLLARIREMGSR